MSKDPALLIYTKDFLEGTSDLSVEEFGAFTRLIFHQHQRGVLPKDLKKLARLSGVSLSEFEEIWKEIHAKFTLSDSGYVNKRCADEIAKRSQNSRKKSILAILGNWIKANQNLTKREVSLIKKSFSLSDFLHIEDEVERKKEIINHLNNTLTANAKRTHIGNGNEDGNGNVKEKKGEIVKRGKELFEKARVLYPGTKRGFKTEWDNFYKKHADSLEVVGLLHESIEKQITHRKALQVQNRFVPEWKHFQTWINNRCWEEETQEQGGKKPKVTLNAVNPNRK